MASKRSSNEVFETQRVLFMTPPPTDKTKDQKQSMSDFKDEDWMFDSNDDKKENKQKLSKKEMKKKRKKEKGGAKKAKAAQSLSNEGQKAGNRQNNETATKNNAKTSNMRFMEIQDEGA